MNPSDPAARSPWPLSRRAAKRAFDLALSSVALGILGVPLVALAAAVRLDSPGPALFRQRRVGRGGRPFRIWKLRTMVADAEARGPTVTAQGDPRVTRLGRVLRRSKLDELPQLVNVLVGDMSFVGPRPEVPRWVALYPPEDRAVLAVRPGITDPASIVYRDEEAVLAAHLDRDAAYRDVLMPKKLALARRYVEEQTFARDLYLMFRTVEAVVLPPRS